MRLLLAIVCTLLAGSSSAQHAQPPSAVVAPVAAPAMEFAGLWKAKRRFGPDAQGPLIIQRDRGGAYVADIAGHVLPVRTDGDEIAFDLPGDEGAFRGRLAEGGTIRGHWIRPPTPANSSRYATPVVLRRGGGGYWSGQVDTLQDELTFYLLIGAGSGPVRPVVLRNPERDIGTQIGARRLAIDGPSLTLLGGRAGQPEGALAHGSYDADNQTLTLDFPNRGGAFVFQRDGDDSAFYPRGRHPSSYLYRAPPQRDDGWQAGTLDGERIDRAAMERLVQQIAQTPTDSADAPQIHALLVARHGTLVFEEYFHGHSRDRLHDTRSAAKSLTAVTIGAAMHAGAAITLASPVYSVMSGLTTTAETEPAKRAMTLEHLLTMSSGYYCDDTDDAAPGNEETMAEQTQEPDYYRYTLRVPLATTPGLNAVYCSASPNLALGMLGRATGEPPQVTFDRLVGAPLQMERYAWILDPLNRPYGGGSVQLLPRDFLKLGQLMLNSGTWAGHQILDRSFVSAATAPQYHLRNVLYGYLWWVEDLPYKERMVRSFSARGAGGNVVTVVPALQLVAATMAGNYSSRVQIKHTGTIVPRSILPAVREPGDDMSVSVRDRAYETPYGRSADGSRVNGGR